MTLSKWCELAQARLAEIQQQRMRITQLQAKLAASEAECDARCRNEARLHAEIERLGRLQIELANDFW